MRLSAAAIAIVLLSAGCRPSVTELQQQVLVERQKLTALQDDFRGLQRDLDAVVNQSLTIDREYIAQSASLDDMRQRGAAVLADTAARSDALLAEAAALNDQITAQMARVKAAEDALAAAR